MKYYEMLRQKSRKTRHKLLELILRSLKRLILISPASMIYLLMPIVYLIVLVFGIPSHIKIYRNLKRFSLVFKHIWSLVYRFLCFLYQQPLTVPYTPNALMLIETLKQEDKPSIFVLTHFSHWELIAIDLIKKGISLHAITAYHQDQPLSRALKKHRSDQGLLTYHQGDIKQILQLGLAKKPLLFVTDLLGLNQKSIKKHKFKDKNQCIFLGKKIYFSDVPDRVAEHIQGDIYAILPCYIKGHLYIDLIQVPKNQVAAVFVYQSLEKVFEQEPKSLMQWVWIHDLFMFADGDSQKP